MFKIPFLKGNFLVLNIKVYCTKGDQFCIIYIALIFPSGVLINDKFKISPFLAVYFLKCICYKIVLPILCLPKTHLPLNPTWTWFFPAHLLIKLPLEYFATRQKLYPRKAIYVYSNFVIGASPAAQQFSTKICGIRGNLY